MIRWLAVALSLFLAAPSLATVSTTTTEVSTAATASQTVFTFSFHTLATTDIKVYVNGVLQGSGYAVALNATQKTNPGGTVTFASGRVANDVVRIKRSTSATQPTAFTVGSAFPARSTEAAMDRLALASQDVAAGIQETEASILAKVTALNGSSAAVTSASSVLAYGSTTPRTLTTRFAERANVMDFGCVADGVTNDAGCIQAAINSVSGGDGGIVYFPAGNYNLGTTGLTVAQTAHGVKLVGAVRSQSTNASGVRLQYTGTGAALTVGDSTNDNLNFHLEDLTININGAGSAAIGILLNRAKLYTMIRPRVTGLLTASSQRLIDLEGFTNYTGGLIQSAYLSNGGSGVYFGRNANANTLIDVHYAGVVGSSIGLNFAGGASENNGNFVFGGDIENCATAIYFDVAQHNHVSTRIEAATTAVYATANATLNNVWSINAHTYAVTDLGPNNSISDPYYTQFRRNWWEMKNIGDSTSAIVIGSGLTAAYRNSLYFRDRGTNMWEIYKGTANDFGVYGGATGLVFLNFGASNSQINSTSGGSVLVNMATNAGTGGLMVGSGGASPAAMWSVNNTGQVLMTGKTFGNLGTPVNGALVYCSDCTVANPCAGGGTGAFAKRLNGAWVCN